MLSVHSLSAGGEARYITYYLGGVAKGVDEYYTEGGDHPASGSASAVSDWASKVR